jgi:hypothetical protein
MHLERLLDTFEGSFDRACLVPCGGEIGIIAGEASGRVFVFEGVFYSSPNQRNTIASSAE